MPILNPGILRSQAKTRLQDSGASRLVLIHTGLLLALSILASGINLVLNDQISTTGGLSGLGARSMLQSLQTFLQLGTSLFTPFWHAGFTMAMLNLAAGLAPKDRDLLHGFRRWGAVLAQQLYSSMLFISAGLFTAYLAATLFAMTPFAAPLAEIVTPMMSSGTPDLTAISPDVLAAAYVPLLLIYGAILIPILLFLSLSFRLSGYLILDHNMGGFAAIYFSMIAMRGKRLKMLKLDLSFWWYYLIEILLSIVCYLDVILPMLGISLPFNETIAFFAALILYAVLELLFQLWKKPLRDVTYALAYKEILHSLEIPHEST